MKKQNAGLPLTFPFFLCLPRRPFGGLATAKTGQSKITNYAKQSQFF
jgi:hypothetical protein